MASKATIRPADDPAVAAAAAAEVKEQEPEREWTWADLADEVEMPSKPVFSGIRANVLVTVPEPIRRKAERSLTINAARVAAKADSTAKRSRVVYHWAIQPVPDEQKGNEFVKALTKYAKYRPTPQAEHDESCAILGDGETPACTCPASIPFAGDKSPAGQVTARCGSVSHYAKGEDGTYASCPADAEGAILGVRYSVRPFEQRGDTARVPGTE